VRRLAFLLLTLPVVALGARDVADPYAGLEHQYDSDYNENLEKPWVEIETQVKHPPEDADLTELEIMHLPPGMTLYADLKHLDVDKRDYVTRTWLVIRSRAGAYNASYEGIRCATREYKVYAYYNPKRHRKPLRTVKLPRWRLIRNGGYRDELARDVLCSDTNPRDPDAIRVKPQLESGDYRSPYE
jgi:hypothetical protein